MLIETLADAEWLFPVTAVGNDRLGLRVHLAHFSTVVGTDFEWTLARPHARTRTRARIEAFKNSP